MADHDPFGLVGQVLDGQYSVDARVGEGGFSVVYKGTHLGLSEPIAIKCLKLPSALGSALVESFVRRFRDESRLHYKLSQGNLHIARSIASGTTIAPATSALVPYIVLEWLDGRSLAEEFHDRRARGLRGRPLPDVVKMLDSAVDALAHAHAQGVVHRDLNPGNLFLATTSAGVRLKVLDFGVAKILDDSTLAMGPTTRTVGNVRMFAPAYGAPEQFDDRVGRIGPWTDVYAIALVLLEALTDRTVMHGEHLGEFALKALDPARRPTPRALGASVGDSVERVLASAVALAPQDRPQDAGQLWGALKNAMRADETSGRAPHALAAPSEAPSPSTVRIPPVAPQRTSPAVELVRPPSAPPERAPRLPATTQRLTPPPQTASQLLASAPMPSNAPRAPFPPLPPPPRVPSMDWGSRPPTSAQTVRPVLRRSTPPARASESSRWWLGFLVLVALAAAASVAWAVWLRQA